MRFLKPSHPLGQRNTPHRPPEQAEPALVMHSRPTNHEKGARDTAFNGESGTYGNRRWSVEARVPSLEQARQGTPQPTAVLAILTPVISVNMYPNM